MSTITSIGNFAINNGIIIFVISLCIFLGRSVDKFVKNKSKREFARNFLRVQKVNYIHAAKVSLDTLDRVFQSRKVLGYQIPKFTRLYVVSIIISTSLMLYYLLISSNNYFFVMPKDIKEIYQSLLIFKVENSFDFIFIILLPLLLFFSNPILDFFSYTETRGILTKLISALEKEKSSPLILILMFGFIDLIYSFLLFSFFIYGTRNIYYSLMYTPPKTNEDTYSFLDVLSETATEPFKLVDSFFSGFGVDGLYGGILLSTFISTLFVWFIYFSYVLSTLQKYLSSLLSLINKHTHILRIFLRKPFTIMSYLMSGIAIFIDVLLRYL